MRVCVYVCMCVCMCVYMCACVTRARARTHTHTQVLEALRAEAQRTQGKSFRSLRRDGMRRLGRVVNLSAGDAAGAQSSAAAVATVASASAKAEAQAASVKRDMRLSVVLRFQVCDFTGPCDVARPPCMYHVMTDELRHQVSTEVLGVLPDTALDLEGLRLFYDSIKAGSVPPPPPPPASEGAELGAGGGLRESPVVLAMRVVCAVRDQTGPLYRRQGGGRLSLVSQVLDQGSALKASLQLVPPGVSAGERVPVGQEGTEDVASAGATSQSRPVMAGAKEGAGAAVGGDDGEGATLETSPELLQALLLGAVGGAEPGRKEGRGLTQSEATALLESCKGDQTGALYASIRSYFLRPQPPVHAPAFSPSANEAEGASSTATEAEPNREEETLAERAGGEDQARAVAVEAAGKEADEAGEGTAVAAGERVVRDSDVCGTCGMGRRRGTKGGCLECRGKCCYGGVKVRVRECMGASHPLARFKGCDGWLVEPCDAGRWYVAEQGTFDILMPVNLSVCVRARGLCVCLHMSVCV